MTHDETGNSDPRPFARLSPGGTLASALLLLLILIVALVSIHTMNPVELLGTPERTALRVVERDLRVLDVVDALDPWKKRFLELASASRIVHDTEWAWAVESLEEVREIVVVPGPELLASLAILYGESGRSDDATATLELLAVHDASLAAAIRGAYSDADPAMPADLAALRPGWFRDRIRLRQAERAGDASTVAEVRRVREDDRARFWPIVLGSGALEIGLLLLGGACLGSWLLRGRPEIRLADGLIEGAWPGALGFAVLVRGGVLALAVVTLLSLVDSMLALPFGPVVWLTLLASLPLLVLVRRHLLRPNGVGLVAGFGLRVPRNRWGRLLRISLAVFALELGFGWILFFAAGIAGVEFHWAEQVLEEMIWDPLPAALLGGVDGVVWAPLLEEIGFRGVLYVTLRSRLRPLPAAAVTAVLFAVLHPYSLLAFGLITWSAILWAWVYEKTGSLLPGILSHFLGNFLVISGLMLYYR